VKLEEYDDESDFESSVFDYKHIKSSIASAAFKASVLWQDAQDKGTLGKPIEVLTPPRHW